MRVSIDRNTGAYESFRWLVVPDDEYLNERPRFRSKRAMTTPEVESGDYVQKPLEPSISVGSALAAKQVILQKIRDAEREQILNDFRSARSTVSGTIKRMDGTGSAVVEAGKIERFFPGIK